VTKVTKVENMKTFVKILLGCLIVLAVNSCEKGHVFDCFKGTGDITVETRPAGAINRIILNDNINLIIKQDTIESIQVEAGEKINGSILTELQDGELTISNDNRCNWVRSFRNEFTVYVSVTELNYIYYVGSGNISSLNSIESEWFEFECYDGAGSVDLSLDTETSWIVIHLGVVDVEVKGNSDISYVYTAGYGPVDCVNLMTGITYITNNGSNNCFINVKDELGAKIGSMGNIYYKGNPDSIEKTITGSGQLIPLD